MKQRVEEVSSGSRSAEFWRELVKEWEASGRSQRDHLELRTQLSAPVTEEVIAWCREYVSHYPPKSPMAVAIGYVINQWSTLIVFLKDPRLRLDNNVSERALRIQALGRNKFLFVGHDEAGQNLAILQTIGPAA